MQPFISQKRLNSEKEMWFDRIPRNGSKKLMIYRKVKSEYEYYHPDCQIIDDGAYEKIFHNAFNRELKQQDYLIYRVFDKKTPLHEQWINIMEANEILKENTVNKKFNPKYGPYCVDITTTGLLKTTVLKHLMVNTPWFKEIPNCNEVYDFEYDFIEGASHGPITWCEPTPFEMDVHISDIDSLYPYIYGQCEDFYFPKRFTNRLETFEFVPNKFQFGIYSNLSVIFPPETHKIAKIVLTHRNGYYTHYDLNLAVKLNAKIVKKNNDQMIEAVIYRDEDLLSSTNFFCNYLTPLKRVKTTPRFQKARELAKAIMNSPWGIMSEHAKGKCVYNGENESLAGRKALEFSYQGFNTSDATDLEINYKCDETGDFIISSIWKRTRKYSGPFPRIKPFILSYARCLMVKHALSFNEDDIVRIHTDCFWLKNQNGICLPKHDSHPNDIGRLYYEGYYHVNVKSLNLFTKDLISPPNQNKCGF